MEAGHRLTLVSAPAGFGKTALLSDWVAGLGEGRSRTRAGWLSLDDADNDLARLLTHLVAALEGVGLALEPAAVTEPLPGDPAAAVTALVNAVVTGAAQAPDAQWVLVLDDYHVIVAPDVHEAMAFLLEHVPTSCTW